MRLFISFRLAKTTYDLTIYNLQFDARCHLFDGGGDVVVYLASLERREHIVAMSGAEQVEEDRLKLSCFLRWDVAQESMGTAVKDGNLFLHGHGLVLIWTSN